MGSSSGGNGGAATTTSSTTMNKKKIINFRSRQRANMSFFIVVMFFAVFGIIVFTEIFLIDERGRGAGVLVRHGSLTYHHRNQDKDYEDLNDDYISLHVGPISNMDDTVGALLMGGRPPIVLPIAADDDHPPLTSKMIIENQLPPYPYHLTPSNGSWQNVNGTKFKFYVFSAFFDKRKGQKCVRVIGTTKTRGPERAFCRLWYKITDGNFTTYNSYTTPAKIKVIRENWNLKYSASFIICPLLPNQTVPYAVSIVNKIKNTPTNLILVINNNNDTKPIYKFGACVKALHFDFNRALPMLEFIELNRIMGVEHFTFYNHTIGPQVNCILEDYIKSGVVTMLPWKLNIVSQKEIRTEGLFAALNDCLYRSMYRYSHVLLIDLDEFIVPRHNDTLPQLITYLNKRMSTRTTGSYSFQNAFFYLQWGDDESIYDDIDNDLIGKKLITLRKTRRRSKLHPHKQRSKYICRPELVVEAGNHFVWEFIPGHGTLNVPSDAAILHHYRICEFGGDDCIKTPSTIDKTTYKYKNKLIKMINEKFYKLKNKCELEELVSPHARVFNKIINILKNR